MLLRLMLFVSALRSSYCNLGLKIKSTQQIGEQPTYLLCKKHAYNNCDNEKKVYEIETAP